MPRILTNKFNLPDTVYKACVHDTYKVAGDISVTTLMDAPQVRILKRKHQYEEDVVENLWALMGTALHHILERANIDSVRMRAFLLTAETIMKEAEKLPTGTPDEQKRANQMKGAANYIFSLVPILFPEVGKRYLFEVTLRRQFGDTVLYGTFDLFDTHTGILYDYKFCSVYAWIFPESRDKWKKQTNVYAYLLEQEGHKVNGVRIIAFFRDWSDHNLIRNKDYPKMQIMEIPVELGDPKDKSEPWQIQVARGIQRRLELHKRADQGDISPCTGRDRWAKADEWAVKSPGAKKALFKHDQEAVVRNYIAENNHKYNDKLWIEYRPGDSVRCAKYCPVAAFCEQRKKELENQNRLSQ